MRSLNRNKRKIYYKKWLSDETIYDEHGNETGEKQPIYGEAVEYDCNISSTMGLEEVQAFGNITNYSRAITIADVNCPLSENDIAEFGEKEYIVVRKSDSKNGLMYALQELPN